MTDAPICRHCAGVVVDDQAHAADTGHWPWVETDADLVARAEQLRADVLAAVERGQDG